jgi:hypothetical protein
MSSSADALSRFVVDMNLLKLVQIMQFVLRLDNG